MAKIGIYGGTFDPIHLGHLITAQFVLEQRKLEKILFIPCNISPHKIGFHSTPAEHRLNMVKIATASNPLFEVSDYEIQKGDVSYTLDTIKHFVDTGNEIELVIGYDNLLVFDKWKEPDEILKLAKVVVLKRHSQSGENKSNKYFSQVEFLDTPIIDISSTDIRDRVRNRKSIKYLLPDDVIDYINRNELYKI